MPIESIDDLMGVADSAYRSLHGPLGAGARTVGSVQPPQGIKTAESNVNPDTTPPGVPTFVDPVRSSDFNSRPSRRGYITMFLNPWQFWREDYFSGGKLVLPSPLATMMTGGMNPDGLQRANIPSPVSQSYGDLVTRTAESMGIDPYTGW